MGDKIKIFPAEINGVNQADEDCERKLTADIIELDPVVDTYDDVQAWIENQPGASAGFGFGRVNANAGAYLEREGGVVTNRVGKPITFDGLLTEVYADNQTSTSYTIVIFEHDGNLVNRTDLYTLVVSGATGDNATGLSVSVTGGKQLGVQVTVGSASNIGVTCILKG